MSSHKDIEVYVDSLYWTLLDRAPDPVGFKSHVAALKRTNDPMKTFQSFINSEEYTQRRPIKLVNYAFDNEDKFLDCSDELGYDFDTNLVLEASISRFSDVDFVYKLGSLSKLVGRKKHAVKTIAVYYHRMHDGGTERVTAWQINAWSKLGYKVILIADEGRDEKDYDYPSDIVRIVIPHKLMYAPGGEYAKRGKALANALQSAKADVFVTNLAHEVCTVWDILVAKSLGIPVILGWHNIFDASYHDGSHLDLARLRMFGFRYADLMYVLTSMDQAWFALHGYAARVVRNPPTFASLPETTSSLGGKTVVWIARVERHQKRVDLAIRMFPLVLAEHPDAKLLIIGGGPDLAWAKNEVAALGIGSRVGFTGYTSDVTRYLKDATVHLMTSEFEGYGLVLEEAWSYGVPTAMFEMPYLELVKSGRGFIAVPQENVQALARAVSSLLSDDGLRRTLGAEARSVAEEFQTYSGEKAWLEIFKDLATEDRMGPGAEELNISPDCGMLIRRLSDKILYTPRVSTRHALTKRPSTPQARTLEKVAEAAADVGKRVPLLSFAPLETIDLTQVPLGDNLMLWTGLYTLLDHQLPVCAPGCNLHVNSPLVGLCRVIFEKFGLNVVEGAPHDIVRPYYTPHAPRTLRECWRAYFGSDWYMDWVEATDRQKSIPRPHVRDSLRDRIRLFVSERVIYKRNDWKTATPSYNGYKVWWPLAFRLGVTPVIFCSMMCQSLQNIRQIVTKYADDLIAADPAPPFEGCAAFPVGNSYQTVDADTYADIMAQVGTDKYTCFIQDDSPWRDSYLALGIKTTHMRSVEETFKVIRSAKTVFTCCSFTSHVAQLLRDDYVLAIFKDFHVNNVHPGARPIILSSTPACAPCNYLPRQNFDKCPAGYDHCTALDDPRFRTKIASELKLRCS